MSRLLDTNVIIRVLLEETTREEYAYCVSQLQQGGVVTPVIAAEVAHIVRGVYKAVVAQHLAEKRGEIDKFNNARKVYILQCRDYPPHWSKKAFQLLRDNWVALLKQYPAVEIAARPIFDRTLELGIKYGLDWADMYLMALWETGKYSVQTIDSGLLKVCPELGSPVTSSHERSGLKSSCLEDLPAPT